MTQLAPALEKRLYTLDEFENLDLPADGSRYELIDIEIVVSPPPGDEHGRIINDLSYELNVFVRAHKLGQNESASLRKVEAVKNRQADR